MNVYCVCSFVVLLFCYCEKMKGLFLTSNKLWATWYQIVSDLIVDWREQNFERSGHRMEVEEGLDIEWQSKQLHL